MEQAVDLSLSVGVKANVCGSLSHTCFPHWMTLELLPRKSRNRPVTERALRLRERTQRQRSHRRQKGPSEALGECISELYLQDFGGAGDQPGPGPDPGGQGGVPRGGAAPPDLQHKAAELSLEQGCLLWGSRVVISQGLRAKVLHLLHAGYPGVEKTKMMARSQILWPGLDQDITYLVQGCKGCQEHQRASHHVEITSWPFPQRPWSRLHVDFAGPFKGRYLWTLFQSG
ncbi:uncharacterized protein LOC121047251 [Ixodes scapularis]|uniref:uncharacterized protein LOC121047251 n=1 Tax=Ixodes scapularis TaxID=6945 RepID=UPI001AD6EF7F|nr:uncharacterized protein LOC121047251 [Ixodes scapularis]